MLTILHILFRALSGATNGFFYSGRTKTADVISWVMALGCAILCFFGNWWSFPFLMISAFAFISKGAAFWGDKTFGSADIHFWETIAMGCIPIAMVLSGIPIIGTVLGVYPGLFLHKCFVNKGSGLGVFANQTDDITGRTYGMVIPKFVPVFGGQKVNVPRTGQYFRLVVALVSIGLMFVKYPHYKFWIINL